MQNINIHPESPFILVACINPAGEMQVAMGGTQAPDHLKFRGFLAELTDYCNLLMREQREKRGPVILTAPTGMQVPRN